MSLLLPKKATATKPSLNLSAKPTKATLKLAPPAQQLLPFSDDQVDRTEAAENVRKLARGFRLRFRSLGSERTLNDHDKQEMISGRTDAASEMLRIVKKIYAPHPELKKLSSAKNRLTDYFLSRTLPFPEDSVRLFMLVLPDNADTMSTDELDEALALQTNRFREEMRAEIAKYDDAVQAVRTNWEDILAAARDKLKSQFDIRMYPTADKLQEKLACSFSSYNLEVSQEWKHLSEKERERELAIVRQGFEAAVAKQEEFVLSLMDSAISQLVNSVSDYSGGKTKFFKDSVVTRVFDAFDEFQKKTVRYGILKGTQVEQLFGKVRDVLRKGGTDRELLPDLLRKSDERRAELVSQMQTLGNSLTALVQSGQARRRLL